MDTPVRREIASEFGQWLVDLQYRGHGNAAMYHSARIESCSCPIHMSREAGFEKEKGDRERKATNRS
jgi:hypothetical protein